MEKDETECGETLVKKKTISQDQVTNVIGEVGRWQLEKILIVFLASAPGEECRIKIKSYLTCLLPAK